MAKTLLPADFDITEPLRRWAQGQFPAVDLERATAEFRDHWIGNGKMMADWQATWRNWIRRSQVFKKPYLTARPPPRLPTVTSPDIDQWEAAGARHLLKHIRIRVGRNPRRWGDPGTLRSGHYVRKPSPDFDSQVRALVDAKNSWVADMRDLDRGEGVPRELQKKVWVDYIARAEKRLEKAA